MSDGGYVSPHLIKIPEIAESLRRGEEVSPISVREFLGWFFGTQRRGRWIVGYIRNQLDISGLKTNPDFESTYLGAELRFELVPGSPERDIDALPMQPDTVDSVTMGDHVEVRTAHVYDDPTYRISKLAAANRKPVSVKPDASVSEAVTLMMTNDFSQLPVMTNEREVKGVISWKSIGSRLVLGIPLDHVRDAMDSYAEVGADASLFSVIPLAAEHDYVLVRATDQKISGIITTSDLSLQFNQLSEPFLLLGEIENHLRVMADSKFNRSELETARDPADSGRQVGSASDLTFGEYQRLLEDPRKWQKLSVNIDRVVFIKRLEDVRCIRNDVMHFDPDGIDGEDLDELRDFAKFLRGLRSLGVI